MPRRITPPTSPRDGLLIHPPRPAADPNADTIVFTFWADQLDVRSTSNQPHRLRALLGHLLTVLVENPSLLDVIAGLRK